MQMCGECGRVYDESEYSRCPKCYGYSKIIRMRLYKRINFYF